MVEMMIRDMGVHWIEIGGSDPRSSCHFGGRLELIPNRRVTAPARSDPLGLCGLPFYCTHA